MKVMNVPATAVQVSKFHWERNHQDDDINDLASEIDSVGLIHPITVRGTNGRYELIAGRKRFLAMRDVLGLREIPASVIKTDDVQAELVSLYENLGQSELSQADVDFATSRAVELEAQRAGTDVTPQVIDMVAVKIKQKPAAVKDSIKRETTLIPEAKQALKDGLINKTQANELVKSSKAEQKTLLEEIIEGGATSKDVRQKRIVGKKGETEPSKVNLRTAERLLKQALTSGGTFRKELAKFTWFVENNKMKKTNLGNIKSTAALGAIEEELKAAKKILQGRSPKGRKE
jgi:ParB family chromosome partitioning protein